MTEQQRRSHWPVSVLSMLSSLLNMLLPLLLVRILTPEEVGIFKIFFLYLMILPTFSLSAGLLNGLAYWAGRPERERAVQSSSAQILLLAALAAGLAFMFRVEMAGFLGWQETHALLFVVALFGAVAAEFFVEAAIATGRIWRGALFYSIFEAVRTVVLVLTAYFTRSLTAIFVAHAAVVLLKVAAGYLYGYLLKLVRLNTDLKMLTQLWRYGLPVSFAEVLQALVARADQVILAALVAPSDFAFYAIGCLVVPPLYIIEQSVTRVLIPQLSEAFAGRRLRYAAGLYSKAVDQMGFIIIPAVAGLVVFAEPIIRLLFTEHYASAAGYLTVFAFSYLFFMIPFDAVPRACGQAGWILKFSALSSVLSLGLALGFIVAFGPFGALAGLLLSRSAMTIYAINYMKRMNGWLLSDFLPLAALRRYTLISLLLAAISLILQPLFPSQLSWFLVLGPFFGILYFILLAVWKIETQVSNEKATVLIILQSLYIGGLERMILALTKSLHRTGRFLPCVFAFDHMEGGRDATLTDQFNKIGIPTELYQKRKGFSVSVLFKLLRKVLSGDVQVVHTHELGGLIYASLVKILSFRRFALVHTQHSFVHLQKFKRYRLYEKLFTAVVDELVVVAPAMRDAYIELGFNPARIQLVENGLYFCEEALKSRVDRFSFRKKLLAETPQPAVAGRLEEYMEDTWIIYLARIHPVKGQRNAVKLWRHISKELRQRSVLLFVGPVAIDEDVAALQAEIDALPQSDRVIITGSTFNTAEWLLASDIFLSCSEYEGMPLAPLEAVGLGLPVVLSNIVGHEFLRGTAELFALDSPQQGADSIAQIAAKIAAEPEQTLQDYWVKSQWVRDRFAVSRMSDSYQNIYHEVLTAISSGQNWEAVRTITASSSAE